MISRALAGVVVLIPILAVGEVPDWNMAELPNVFPSGVHNGTKSTVPLPARFKGVEYAVELARLGADVASVELGAAASTKAEGGNPPMVAASPAFSA